MQYDVNQGQVEWVVRRLAESLGNGQFSTGEVILGIAQFAGMTIVGMAETPVAGFSAAHVFQDHLNRTIAAGYSAKGYNTGPN